MHSLLKRKTGYAATRIETERLVLRPLRVDDAETFFEWYRDPETMRFMGGVYPGTVADMRARLALRIAEHESAGFGLLATELRATGELIGRCGQIRQIIENADEENKDEEDKEEIEVGYLIARPHWGRGYATEAARALLDDGFARFEVPRLISLIHPENIASQRVAGHNGLRYEGDVRVLGMTISPIRLYALATPPKTA
ncbi:MAG: GNAT family N-acetyltransferase [Candidatus Eremiobacteraeota bacterium]|nr:GNAT family N-acetyltransferase [Candidatus Eremiobacteraeota bacterium]